jgi:hypothetical protein
VTHWGVVSGFVLAALSLTGTALGEPITKISSLSPRYNAGEIEITWETPLAGGCTTSSLAVTNAGAANHQSLVAFLLAAFAANASVEVFFGGGCATGGINWIQTVKLVK